MMNLGSEEIKVQFFIFGLFLTFLIEQVQCLGFLRGLNVGLLVGQTWIQVSVNFVLSSSKEFEVCYTLVH